MSLLEEILPAMTHVRALQDEAAPGGISLDPSKGGKMSMEKKRELVYEISNWSEGWPELLQSWSRQEILQILCVEMGKERKYTGLTKLKIIEHLLKIVSEKKSGGSEGVTTDLDSQASPMSGQRAAKRQRKTEQPSRLATAAASVSTNNGIIDLTSNVIYCKNSACRATLNREGTEKYQKLYELVDEASKKLQAEVGPLDGLPVKMGRGIVNRLSSGPEVQKLCSSAVELLDSMNSNVTSDPLPNPIKQDKKPIGPNMIKFEDTRATSLTIFLQSQNILSDDNVLYSLWHCKVDDINYPKEPTCKLLAPNTRFVVRDLTPATEYCFKVVSHDGTKELGTSIVRFSTSNADELTNCHVPERSQSPATNCSSLSNPSSVEDETNNVALSSEQADTRQENYLSYCKDNEKVASGSLSNGTITFNSTGEGENKGNQVSLLDGNCSIRSNWNGVVPFAGSSDAGLPITPCKIEILKEGLGRNVRSKSSSKDLENAAGKGEPQDGSTSKKRNAERPDEECAGNGLSDRDFEYYVKVIRWLECEGHIEKNFRQKFLTWYSLRASSQELRIVKVFIDTFIEEPASLAEQLVDTFTECISSKRSSVVPSGFCMKLWH
uniref:Fibronectin type-III domain-containing protein n=1 Tax=Cannabis sativa TaxID=3483 RepID=A0A803Q9Q0_CANSA